MPPSTNTHGIARIVRPAREGAGERHIGTAFVLGPRHVMTCCHVVNDTLGRTYFEAAAPLGARFVVRFPYADNAREAGKVVKWGLDHPRPVDVAVLELERDAPATAGVAVFSYAEVRGEQWSCIGWDADGSDRETKGSVGAVLPRGERQLHGPDGVAARIVPGYSGAPVWAEGVKAYIGMVASKDRDDAMTGLAFAIPPSVLAEVWPELPLVPGSTAEGSAPLGGTAAADDKSTPRPYVPVPVEKRAFVIQSVGERGSDTRKRADRVMEELIRPVCKELGFLPVRAHELPEGRITEPIISALYQGPLVIADLGAHPRNPNVLIEVGFRLSNGRPIVFLADRQLPTPPLPIHLEDRRILDIDPAEPRDERQSLLRNIRSQMEETPSGWISHFPYVDFQAPLDAPEKAICTYANDKAARMYGLDAPEVMWGQRVVDLDDYMSAFMPDSQREAFEEDQTKLGVVFNPTFAGHVNVEVPIWFSRHRFSDENGKVYLPLLALQRFDTSKRPTVVMRTLFVEITSWSWKDFDKTHSVLRIPQLFRETRGRYENEFFLAFDPADARYLKSLGDKLSKQLKLKTWYEENGVEDVKPPDLVWQISASLMVGIPVGRGGIGRWARTPAVRDALVEHCRARKAHVFLLLPGVAPEDEMWRENLPTELNAVLESPLYVPVSEPGDATPGRVPFGDRVLRELILTIRGSRPA